MVRSSGVSDVLSIRSGVALDASDVGSISAESMMSPSVIYETLEEGNGM